jgi:UDP-GlcNAc:undecaprenyl-phosphate/decaprenyl-phosphate GlcNAc-1-phosphate transferase
MNIAALLSAFLITSLSFVALRPLAGRWGLLDIPGGRKQHKLPTPLIGGLGIYLGTLCISLLSPLVMEQYGLLLAISGLILAIGILDDARELSPSTRLLLHSVAAWLMAVEGGNQLQSLGHITFAGPIELGVLAVPITIFATVGVINAVNMTDGLDGLSGGLVVIALIFLSIIALSAGNSAMLDFSTILICSLLAFLVLNFRMLWKKSAAIYLGDAGSTLLGFIIAWLVIAATQGESAIIAPVYALWFMAIPLMDTISLLIRRPRQGRSPFSPGTDHLHHRLLAAGYTQEQTVLGMYGAGVAIGCIGLLGYFLGASEGLMFVGFLALFALYMLLPIGKTPTP